MREDMQSIQYYVKKNYLKKDSHKELIALEKEKSKVEKEKLQLEQQKFRFEKENKKYN